MSKNVDQKWADRNGRIEAAIALEPVDRVPFFPSTNLLAVKYAGISVEQAFYNYDLWFEGNRKMILDLDPDMYWPAVSAYPGRAFDAVRHIRRHA